jgi:K+ transporter
VAGLLLNYFGQGALVLEHWQAREPVLRARAEPMLPLLVILATAATIIASGHDPAHSR